MAREGSLELAGDAHVAEFRCSLSLGAAYRKTENRSPISCFLLKVYPW
jgi:hypothetical protein